MAYLGFNLLGLIVEGLEEEADLGGLALLVEEDADPLHLGGEVLAAGQHEAHVVSQEHATLRPGTRKAESSVGDPYVFGPARSGSISQMYGSGSLYHQAK